MFIKKTIYKEIKFNKTLKKCLQYLFISFTTIIILTILGSSHSPISSSKDEQGDKDTSKCTKTENDQGMPSCRLVTNHKDTMKHVLQMAAITFLFGICIIGEVALIMWLTTGKIETFNTILMKLRLNFLPSKLGKSFESCQ